MEILDKARLLKEVEWSCRELYEHSINPKKDWEPVEFSKVISDVLADTPGESNSPADMELKFIGKGVYKEAYEIDGLCFKFAVGGYITEAEIEIYENVAPASGIDYIFCPTAIYRLDKKAGINLEHIHSRTIYPESKNWKQEEFDNRQDDGGVYYTSDPRIVNSYNKLQIAEYLFIQPKVAISGDVYGADSNRSAVDGEFKFNGERVTPIYNCPEIWQTSVIETYGLDRFNHLREELERAEITDLHPGNVGWINLKPIIIDWMSENTEFDNTGSTDSVDSLYGLKSFAQIIKEVKEKYSSDTER